MVKNSMIRPVTETIKKVADVLQRHCNYYGVNGDLRSLYEFHDYMNYMTHKMLNRCSQRGNVIYEKFQRIGDYYVKPPQLTKDVWQWVPRTV